MGKEEIFEDMVLYRVVFIGESNLRVDRKLALSYGILESQIPEIIRTKFNKVKSIEKIEWLGEGLSISEG